MWAEEEVMPVIAAGRIQTHEYVSKIIDEGRTEFPLLPTTIQFAASVENFAPFFSV